MQTNLILFKHFFHLYIRIDVFVKANLIKLCEIKHPTWSIEKIRNKYWYPDFDGQYVYALKDKSDVRVKRLADTVIIEHKKIKTNANPYLDAEYLGSRNDEREILTVSRKYRAVWNRQGGRCYYCGTKFAMLMFPAFFVNLKWLLFKNFFVKIIHLIC